MKKQIFNPYLPNYEYIPDGEPHIYNDRLFIYGSHDRFNAPSFCENDYVTWSAPLSDLSNWKYHGVIFRKDQDPLNSEGKYPLFAPDCVQGKDGRYYLYYCPAGTQSIGVAVSDKPEGPFDFLDHVRDTDNAFIGRRNGDPYPFDPAVYIDNGRILLFVGFSPDPSWDFLAREYPEGKLVSGPYVIELADDMHTAFSCKPVTISGITDPGHQFLEASSLRKINGRHYFIYSSQYSHELCYGISNDPTGPFEYRGIIHDNGDIGLEGVTEENRRAYSGNNHGSLIEINGQWYIFGHRPTNYSVFSRQGVAEKITILENGDIPQIEMTSCGLNGDYLKTKGTYGSFIACHLTSATGAIHYIDNCTAPEFSFLRKDHPALTQDGEDRENNPGQYIRNMKDGATAGFKYFSGCDTVNVKVFTRGGKGLFEIRTELDGEIKETVHLKESDEFTESTSAIINTGNSDKFALYFTYRGKEAVDFQKFALF